MIFRRKIQYLNLLLYQKRSKHFITTPIFYVNAKPHIGHLYTALIADAVARHQKMKYPDEKLFFMTGTDEHGLKIQHSAKQSNCNELEYVDHVCKMYRDLFTLFNIQHTDFLRTTQQRHVKCVHSIWNRLMEKGHIYSGEYSGWYCMADEAFVPDSQLQTHPDGTKTTLDGNRRVEFVQEANYKFRLSSFQVNLLDWLKDDVVRPKKFHQILKDWIEEGSVLDDISVSRPTNRVSWGIPVPNDPQHTIYVWLDALSSYLTSAGFPENLQNWPPDLQIIGKDILKFHGVYWPAFLIAAGFSPPKRLLCHSHWIIDGEKMSKSKGNVVDPYVEVAKFTCDGLRYFLLREGTPHSDGNYSSVKIQRILNSELADTLGNLLNRCTGALVNPAQIVPEFHREHFTNFCSEGGKELIQSLENLPDLVDSFYNNYEFYKGVDAIIATLHLANGFFEREKPWELRKHAEKNNQLSAILHLTVETLRVCGILLNPVVPDLSSKILDRLSVPSSQRNLSHIFPLSWQRDVHFIPSVPLSPKIILFQRIK